MPLAPDLEDFLALAACAPPMSGMTPGQARAAYDAATPAIDAPGAEVAISPLVIPARGGRRVAARLYVAAGAPSPSPVLLFFHGGGYVVGGLESHESLCRDLAHDARAAVLAVDYRLAPEHRFPAAFEDAEDTHAWLLRQGRELGLDTGRLAIGGDSVGGTLAAACCLAAREAGRPQPALQLLLYPCTASWQDSPSHRRLARGYLLEQATLQWMFGHALRGDADRADWRFAPAAAASFAGLAPAHLVLAEFDPLVDEGLAYAATLREAGVPAIVRVAEGLVHDFLRLGAVVPGVRDWRRSLGDALAAAWAA